MAFQEVVYNFSSTMLPSFSNIFIFTEVLACMHILIFCSVCWADFFCLTVLIDSWTHMGLSKVVQISPSHTLYLCLQSSLSSILLLRPLINLQCTYWLSMCIKAASWHISFVELLILVVKGQAYITPICNSAADDRYSYIKVCKQSTFMG